jgi:hypothetical protein
MLNHQCPGMFKGTIQNSGGNQNGSYESYAPCAGRAEGAGSELIRMDINGSHAFEIAYGATGLTTTFGVSVSALADRWIGHSFEITSVGTNGA